MVESEEGVLWRWCSAAVHRLSDPHGVSGSFEAALHVQSVTAEFDLSMRALRNVLAMPINAIEVCMPLSRGETRK